MWGKEELSPDRPASVRVKKKLASSLSSINPMSKIKSRGNKDKSLFSTSPSSMLNNEEIEQKTLSRSYEDLLSDPTDVALEGFVNPVCSFDDLADDFMKREKDETKKRTRGKDKEGEDKGRKKEDKVEPAQPYSEREEVALDQKSERKESKKKKERDKEGQQRADEEDKQQRQARNKAASPAMEPRQRSPMREESRPQQDVTATKSSTIKNKEDPRERSRLQEKKKKCAARQTENLPSTLIVVEATGALSSSCVEETKESTPTIQNEREDSFEFYRHLREGLPHMGVSQRKAITLPAEPAKEAEQQLASSEQATKVLVYPVEEQSQEDEPWAIFLGMVGPDADEEEAEELKPSTPNEASLSGHGDEAPQLILHSPQPTVAFLVGGGTDLFGTTPPDSPFIFPRSPQSPLRMEHLARSPDRPASALSASYSSDPAGISMHQPMSGSGTMSPPTHMHVDPSMDYRKAIARVAAQLHPDLALSKISLIVMNRIVNLLFDLIASKASEFARHNKRNTITSREIQTAVCHIFPEDCSNIAAHCASFANKAVHSHFVLQQKRRLKEEREMVAPRHAAEGAGLNASTESTASTAEGQPPSQQLASLLPLGSDNSCISEGDGGEPISQSNTSGTSTTNPIAFSPMQLRSGSYSLQASLTNQPDSTVQVAPTDESTGGGVPAHAEESASGLEEDDDVLALRNQIVRARKELLMTSQVEGIRLHKNKRGVDVPDSTSSSDIDESQRKARKEVTKKKKHKRATSLGGAERIRKSKQIGYDSPSSDSERLERRKQRKESSNSSSSSSPGRKRLVKRKKKVRKKRSLSSSGSSSSSDEGPRNRGRQSSKKENRRNRTLSSSSDRSTDSEYERRNIKREKKRKQKLKVGELSSSESEKERRRQVKREKRQDKKLRASSSSSSSSSDGSRERKRRFKEKKRKELEKLGELSSSDSEKERKREKRRERRRREKGQQEKQRASSSSSESSSESDREAGRKKTGGRRDKKKQEHKLHKVSSSSGSDTKHRDKSGGTKQDKKRRDKSSSSSGESSDKDGDEKHRVDKRDRKKKHRDKDQERRKQREEKYQDHVSKEFKDKLRKRNGLLDDVQ